jgi:hypothetical protein
MNGRQLKHMDSCRAKRQKRMYRDSKTWLAARVCSVATVGSVESDGFILFFGNSRGCKL